MYRDIPGKLRQLIEPVLADHGCELVDATVTHRPMMVRITVDNESGDGCVGINLCAEISREVGTHLDAAEAIDGSYRLEVSSPGLNRVLAREKDFAAACGSTVKLRTRRPLDGRRRFHGRLVDFEGGLAQLEVDGSVVGIPFESIEKANTIYEFSSEDFDNRVH